MKGPYRRIIKADPAVDDARLAAAGLPVRKPELTPAAAVITHPLLVRVDNSHLRHLLWIADEATPHSWANAGWASSSGTGRGLRLAILGMALAQGGGAAAVEHAHGAFQLMVAGKPAILDDLLHRQGGLAESSTAR